jgi:conjugal transfer ATP-binding protein TraC
MAFAVSQLLSDFDTPVGKAVLANTATKLVLPQEQSSLAELPNYIDLGSKERALIASLEVRKGCFGEFLVKMQGHPSTVGRVIPDPLKYAISTTDAADCAKFNQLLAACSGDYSEAVRQFAEMFPYGRAQCKP